MCRAVLPGKLLIILPGKPMIGQTKFIRFHTINIRLKIIILKAEHTSHTFRFPVLFSVAFSIFISKIAETPPNPFKRMFSVRYSR